jgi:hydroxymethylglutaryl-CoA lyase
MNDAGEAMVAEGMQTTVYMPPLPQRVRIVEVGPRDGLQNEKTIVPTVAKIEFVNRLNSTGIRDIEVTSFVSPHAVPQLADAAEVLRSIEKRLGVRYWVLIPNVKGLERWLEVADTLPFDAQAIALFTAASETFNLKNTNATIAQSLQNFAAIIERLDSKQGSAAAALHGRRPFIRAYVSTAFVCPYEGPIAPDAVERVVRDLVALGVDEISVGDTIGMATPNQVVALVECLLPLVGVERLALHFHDTRGTALANVLAALQLGISIFDSSAGGLGGCPFAPGAAGNLATEDLVYLLDGLGIKTGVSFDAVVNASRYIAGIIGHPLPSKAFQASLALAS